MKLSQISAVYKYIDIKLKRQARRINKNIVTQVV